MSATTKEYPNGDRYEGELASDGKRHGQGRLQFKGGSLYVGAWADDRMHGEGRLQSPSETFEGTFVNGKRHGRGLIKYPDGSKAQGEWRNGNLFALQKREVPPELLERQVSDASSTGGCGGGGGGMRRTGARRLKSCEDLSVLDNRHCLEDYAEALQASLREAGTTSPVAEGTWTDEEVYESHLQDLLQECGSTASTDPAFLAALRKGHQSGITDVYETAERYALDLSIDLEALDTCASVQAYLQRELERAKQRLEKGANSADA